MGRYDETHTSVVAIKEKDGDLKAFVTTDTKYSTLCEIAMNTAELGSEFHTDEYKSYVNFKYYFNHKTVNHSVEYVSADSINTNSIEGFWSLLKRGIKGNFHWLSKKYLQNYITEFEFRYNNRSNDLVFGYVLAEDIGESLVWLFFLIQPSSKGTEKSTHNIHFPQLNCMFFDFFFIKKP